jgi:NAD(P)-dependent dehydrogenase (short-subunit alcohol dehydrogenase family)
MNNAELPRRHTLAVITGGTQVLGLAVARRLAREGAAGIVISGRRTALGESAAAEICALGTRCLYVQADVAKAEASRPMGQLAKPDQLAGLISYMLSPESGVMTGALVDYDQWVPGAQPEWLCLTE